MHKGHVDYKHVREHADFGTIAAHYGLELRGRGDQRTALCCFHKENTGSLKINLAKRIFHCFGCGAKGNILEFVVLKEGGDPDNRDDLRHGAFALADICGIDPDPRGKRSSKSQPRVKKEKEASKAEQVMKASRDQLMRGNKPLSFELKLDPDHPFLKERGLSEETIKSFGLGYCSRGMMKGRIAIPIHNEKGELIAYAGRWPEEDVPKDTPKYLLPEGFEKRSVLFNLFQLPKGTKRIVMVESYFSVFRLHEGGTPVVSPMGHSVSEQHCELLKSHGTSEVVVLFDGDGGGMQGLLESIPLLAQYFYVHAPRVSDGFKPNRAAEKELQELISPGFGHS